MKAIYVTFQIKPTDFVKSLLGLKTSHYAIKCDNEKDAREAASDVYSIDGVTYIRINRRGRLRHRDTKILPYGINYDKELQ